LSFSISGRIFANYEVSDMPVITINLPKQKCRFLALSPGSLGEVIAYADDRATLLKKAKKAGVKKPIIMPVFDPHSRYIF